MQQQRRSLSTQLAQIAEDARNQTGTSLHRENRHGRAVITPVLVEVWRQLGIHVDLIDTQDDADEPPLLVDNAGSSASRLLNTLPLLTMNLVNEMATTMFRGTALPNTPVLINAPPTPGVPPATPGIVTQGDGALPPPATPPPTPPTPVNQEEGASLPGTQREFDNAAFAGFQAMVQERTGSDMKAICCVCRKSFSVAGVAKKGKDAVGFYLNSGNIKPHLLTHPELHASFGLTGSEPTLDREGRIRFRNKILNISIPIPATHQRVPQSLLQLCIQHITNTLRVLSVFSHHLWRPWRRLKRGTEPMELHGCLLPMNRRKLPLEPL